MNNFSFIPCQTKVSPSQLEKSEYFGDSFAAGNCQAAIFETISGSKVIVWTYGNWEGFGVTEGAWCNFQHTQTFRRRQMKFLGLANATYGRGKLAELTLK